MAQSKLSEQETYELISLWLDEYKNAIVRWLPGRSYTYNFTLKKTGIDNITATVKDWEKVKADGTSISLE